MRHECEVPVRYPWLLRLWTLYQKKIHSTHRQALRQQKTSAWLWAQRSCDHHEGADSWCQEWPQQRSAVWGQDASYCTTQESAEEGLVHTSLPTSHCGVKSVVTSSWGACDYFEVITLRVYPLREIHKVKHFNICRLLFLKCVSTWTCWALSTIAIQISFHATWFLFINTCIRNAKYISCCFSVAILPDV